MRIGLLVSISVIILCVGFYFLKGSDIFSNDKEYYCFYSNVQGLQNSAPVQIRGLNVGHVARTELVDGKGVRVVITLSKKIQVPKGTVAALASSDLLGTKMIRLDLGTGAVLESKESLPTTEEGGVLDNISTQITPILKEVSTTILALDTVINGVNAIVGEQNQKVIAQAIASINQTANNLAGLSGTLNKESGQISSILHNANSFTDNLAKNNDTIKQVLANANSITRQLANAPIQQTVTNLQGTIDQLNGIVNKVNTNQGSLGMLINNKDLYNNLTNLMGDIQAHPSRYINVTIFGKKKD